MKGMEIKNKNGRKRRGETKEGSGEVGSNGNDEGDIRGEMCTGEVKQGRRRGRSCVRMEKE